MELWEYVRIPGMNPSFSRVFKDQVRLNPSLCFLLFLISNILLSYFPLGLIPKLTIGLMGLVLPLILAGIESRKRQADGTPFYREEFLGGSFSKPLGVVLLIGILVRVYYLQDLMNRWPALDDALGATYALDLSRRWEWRFFFSQVQIPPVFYWLLAMFFKLVPASIFTMRLVPFIVGLVCLFLAFFGVRKIFSGSFAFFFLSFTALGLWPLYAGFFCLSLTLFMAWEFLTLFLLAEWAEARDEKRRKQAAALLGLAVGIGFFIAIPWGVVALVAGIAVLSGIATKHPGEWGSKIMFLIPVFVFLGFFMVVSLREGNGAHIKFLLGDWGNEPLSRFLNSFSYMSCLFWGRDQGGSYGPAWGGMLNPLLGSFFFLGLLECWRRRSEPFVRWLVLGLVLLFLPGFLTKDFDVFRVLQTLPLLLMVIVLGAVTLAARLPNQGRWWIVGAVLILSFSLDARNLSRMFMNDSPQAEVFSKAYGVLRDQNARSGPGDIFLNLRPNLWDETLDVAVQPFDRLELGSAAPEAKWAAVFVNVHYRPFLEKRFPQARWVDLGEDIFWRYGGLTLGIIPVTPENSPALGRWIKLEDYFHGLRIRAMNALKGDEPGLIARDMVKAGSLTEGDPFLGSCVMEKLFFSKLTCRNDQEALGIIQEGLKKGYPLPQALTAAGVLLMDEGRSDEARPYFQKAASSSLDLTPAKLYLAQLDAKRKAEIPARNDQRNAP